MKKFVAIYTTPDEARANMATMTPEQQAAGMAPWMAWKTKCGDALIDLGAPFAGRNHVDTQGNWGESTSTIGGYSILQAESIDAAKALMEGHPHLSYHPDCSIELLECAAM